MRRNDIRFNGQDATVKHHSARGQVTRNAGNFTRGSQLVTHEFWMWLAGIKIPLAFWSIVFSLAFAITLSISMTTVEMHLVIMRAYSTVWSIMLLDPAKIVNLTLPNGMIRTMPMGAIPTDPFVAHASSKAIRCLLGSGFMAIFLAAPLSVWFIEYSRRRGKSILEERHERGAMLVDRATLRDEIRAHNGNRFSYECSRLDPPQQPRDVIILTREQKRELGIHQPYVIAGIPYPWRLEQSHTILIGTTGAGKTTQLRSLVKQLRERGHNAVIFDLTNAFVEAFYNEETDVILNPMDQRCRPWTIFNDCELYADFLTAATALIPSHPDEKEPFWQNAARTLFVEICMKLRADGEMTNAAIAHHLMTAKLKDIHAKLNDTVAAPLTDEKAARMAESIRSVFNTNANAIRYIPDPSPEKPDSFSIKAWVEASKPGSILFITSSYSDMNFTKMLLTLWTDTAVNAQMAQPRTRDLRTWFLFDEINALHALPAIGNGLQTARNYGRAFVLGIHSFAKLEETYGEKGATNLAGLARTKLILATADYQSAERCTEFIGNREVRQMDEAYSYGYNNTRDASTLTPRKAIEPLVIPDDITNLPSMHGFIKFPDGFPAARIKLKWEEYPEVAPGFLRVTSMVPSIYKPPEPKQPASRPESAEEGGEGGPESLPPTGRSEEGAEDREPEALEQGEKADQRSEAEKAADAMMVTGAISNGNMPAQTATPDRGTQDGQPDGAAPRSRSLDVGARFAKQADNKTAMAREEAKQALTEKRLGKQNQGRTEEQIMRETREGAGAGEKGQDQNRAHDVSNDTPRIDDDFGIGD
ncbi:MAG: type IV secretion system DNA-binding domain-containing protein [Erythrobacter sp.]